MSLTLRDQSLLETRAFVAGQWTSAASRFAVRNPATGAVVAGAACASSGPAASARAIAKRRAAIMRPIRLRVKSMIAVDIRYSVSLSRRAS